MKKVIVLICVTALLLCGCSMPGLDFSGNRGEKYIDAIKNEVLTGIDGTYEKVFDKFFDNGTWEFFADEEGRDFVEFVGNCTFENEVKKAKIRFTITNKKKDDIRFEATYLSLNDVPQTTDTLSELLREASLVYIGKDITEAPAVVTETKPAVKQKANNTVTYAKYTNGRFGFSIDVPTFLIKQRDPDNGSGFTFVSDDGTVVLTVYGSHYPIVMYTNPTIETLYQEGQANADYTITYKAQKNNWYVLSGSKGSDVVYEKYFLKSDGSENVFVITYPQYREKEFDPIVTHISKSFKTGVGIDSDVSQ